MQGARAFAVAMLLTAASGVAAAAEVGGTAAAEADSCALPKFVHSLGFDLRGACVASARKAAENIYVGSRDRHSALSGHVRYAFGYSESTRQGRLYPGAYQGVGVGVTTFFAGGLTGTPVSAYLLQGAPIVRVARNLTFGYEWNFGASFGWKEYEDRPVVDGGGDASGAPLNIIVGSPVNAYINLGFMFDYRLSAAWGLRAGIDLTHYSNGNTSWPNPGVNMIGARVGLTYTFDTRRGRYEQPRTLADNADIEPMKPHLSYDLVLYGAVRKKMTRIDDMPQVLPGHFGIAGLNFAPMYNFNRFLRAGVSLDVQYDESSDIKKYWVDGTTGDDVKFYRPSFFHQVSAGLSARGELVMPIFSINAGMGYNLIGNSDSKNFYQVLALKVNVARGFFLHIGYQLNSFKNPNNLMIGVGYRFHDKR